MKNFKKIVVIALIVLSSINVWSASEDVPIKPEIYINFEVKDADGNVTFVDRQKGHSWTRNFYNLMFGLLTCGYGSNSNNFGAGYISSKNTAGTVRYANNVTAQPLGYQPNTNWINNSASETYGIQVGTGNTAFSPDQYALAALIANGTSAGQFSYAAMSAGVQAYDNTAGAEKWTMTHKRIFNNNSGGEIVVSEVGFVWYGYLFYASGTNNLMERSVLSPTVAVPNGSQLTVTYEISMDFSAID